MENHKIFNLFKFEQVIQTLFAIGVFEKKICFKIIFYRKTKKFDLLFTRMPLISNFSTYGSFQRLMSNKNDVVKDILIFHQTNKGIVTYFSGGFFLDCLYDFAARGKLHIGNLLAQNPP